MKQKVGRVTAVCHVVYLGEISLSADPKEARVSVARILGEECPRDG